MKPRAPTLETANLRNALSTCTSPNTSECSSPARVASYHAVCRNSMRVLKSRMRGYSRSLMADNQRR